MIPHTERLNHSMFDSGTQMLSEYIEVIKKNAYLWDVKIPFIKGGMNSISTALEETKNT